MASQLLFVVLQKESVQQRLDLPAWDVVREGIDGLVGEALKLRRELGKL